MVGFNSASVLQLDGRNHALLNGETASLRSGSHFAATRIDEIGGAVGIEIAQANPRYSDASVLSCASKRLLKDNLQHPRRRDGRVLIQGGDDHRIEEPFLH